MYVDNEIGKLNKVIVHFPDEGISRISPKRSEELLFDDIVFYPLMYEEYYLFLRILNTFVGEKNVLEVQDLLEQSIAGCSDLDDLLIDEILDFEELPKSYSRYLKNLPPADLSKLLITGYLHEDDRILFDPIPNYMFTRDIAVMIKDHILITKAAREARHRENLLSKFIFNHHPALNSVKEADRIIDLNDLELFPPSRRNEVVSAEGGDIMMFTPEHLLIGCSERTTPYAFDSIKDVIFQKGLVEHIVQINIPNDRSFMHIDTLFTLIDTDLVVCYKPIVYDGEGSNIIMHSSNGKSKTFASIKEYLLKEINPHMKFVFSGNGESPFQEREQWTDSCNLVALKPGVGVSYDRNLRTLSQFEEAGYNVLSGSEFLRLANTRRDFANSLEKTIIALPSAELSRARGGSHCMTCPIERDGV